jgi:hypothetical protein
VVLDESKCKDKLTTFLKSGVYETFPKDTRVMVERKVQNPISKQETTLSTDLKYKPVSYLSKPPHPHVLLNIRKPSSHLRFIASSICSPGYDLAGFLCKLLSTLAAKSKSFVKVTAHFIQ